ncbi:MAG: hypothetical protein P8X95_26855 [Anaerolineales bacterium]
MKLRAVFTINFPIAVFFGLSCALLPGLVLQIYGLPPEDGAIWVTRLVGGSIFGLSTLMWFGRKTPSAEARRAIALALFLQDIVGLAASLEIQFSGSVNALGWSNPVLYGALAAAYAYFLFIQRMDIQPEMSPSSKEV